LKTTTGCGCKPGAALLVPEGEAARASFHIHSGVGFGVKVISGKASAEMLGTGGPVAGGSATGWLKIDGGAQGDRALLGH
jgi:hypothetical protein